MPDANTQLEFEWFQKWFAALVDNIGQVVKGNDLNYPADWRLSKKGRQSNEG